MKKYTIVTTYPEQGSKNVGDALITNCTMKAIQDLKGNDIKFNIIWREENWEYVKTSVMDSDAIVFACLAIRPNFVIKEYPFFERLIESKIPFGILAAGTNLEINNDYGTVSYQDITSKSLNALKIAAKKSLFFTTRGLLTQDYCNYHFVNSYFSGDIAFYDTRFQNRKFLQNKIINKIAISDPHYSDLYTEAFTHLIERLKIIFPKSEINVLLHGKNHLIEKLCSELNIVFHKIYENKDEGLDMYDNYDLHIGFRVHAHVSALKRRIYSYLIEQDGRGFDYGLTIPLKLSVNGSIKDQKELVLTSRKILKPFKSYSIIKKKYVDINSVNHLLSIVNGDINSGFDKFVNFESCILEYNKLCLDSLIKLP